MKDRVNALDEAYIMGVFGWEELGLGMGTEMVDSHSNHLAERSAIPISIPRQNGNGLILLKSSPVSPF